MTQRQWALPRSRRENIRSLRDERGVGTEPRLPDFFNQEETKAFSPPEGGSASDFPDPKEKLSNVLLKTIPQGRVILIMNKISFIGLLLALVCMGVFLFLAGILTAYHLLPGSRGLGTRSSATLSSSMATLSSSKAMTQNAINQSLDIAAHKEKSLFPSEKTKLEQDAPESGDSQGSPHSMSVPSPFKDAVKAVTPQSMQPLVDKVLGQDPQNPEFVEGSQKIPTDTDAGRFTVQAKVYGDGAWAMQLCRRLKEEGYGAYIVRIKERPTHRVHYHVRLGTFGDYMPANALVRKLKEMGNRSASVVLVSRNEERITP